MNNRDVAMKKSKGFTLLEIILIIVVIGIALVPLLFQYERLMGFTAKPVMAYRALNLARGLMDEIIAKDFEDPGSPPGSFGLEGLETPTGPRAGYNDADDYDSWQAHPPQNISGQSLIGFETFTERVDVVNVLSGDFNSDTDDGETAYKKVRVTISWDPDEKFVLSSLKVRP